MRVRRGGWQPPFPPPLTTWEPTLPNRIDKRDDVRPTEGEHEYGDVQLADTTNNKYPIDTPEHVRAAWSYINQCDKQKPRSEGFRVVQV